MKKIVLIAALCLVPCVSLAQELNLKVTPPEAETIWKGLRKMPVEDVEQLMAKIRQQVTDQNKPPETTSKVDPKPEDKK